jgi:NAD(P)-dependent dehydrogenase (short-subunit alcohol dehydrogenase family)
LARDAIRLKEAADQVDQIGGRALALQADVADWNDVAEAASRVHREFGPVDVWVNNAMSSVFAPFSALTVPEFTRATAVTYLGFVHGTKAALESMLERARAADYLAEPGSVL